MTLPDLIRYGCIDLRRKRARTLLTALSMAIGVMCVVVLISIGLGYEASYRESVEAMGSLTKLDVTPAGRTYTGRAAVLNDKAVEAFRGLPGVEAVTPVVQQPAYLKSGTYINLVRLYGVELETLESFGITPLEGTAPSAGLRLRPEALVTEDVAPTFSSPGADWAYALDAAGEPLVDPLRSPLRMTFDYGTLTGEQRAGADGRAAGSGTFYTLRATGVCSSQNGNYSAAAFLNLRRLEELLAAAGGTQPVPEAERTYDLVWIKAKGTENVQPIARTLREAGLNVYTLSDMLETVRVQSRRLQGMLGAIGAVAMLVSAICVANTMMMAVTERTREVGILKVLGAPLGSITAMFLIEALLVGLLGGAAGLGLSLALKSALPRLFADAELRCELPPWLAASGVLFAGLAAVLAALIPARRAMHISPNAALRAE